MYKKGNKNDAGNYRPISLTCILCKILESIIKENIMTFLNSGSKISDCQHGFRSKRSCITQLLKVMEDYSRFFDDGKDFDVIYLDFRKAFDSVPHQRLFGKIKSYGIAGNVLNWLKNFLQNRSQRVVVNGQMSTHKKVISTWCSTR